MRWPSEGHVLHVDFPFPSSGGRFFSAAGKELADDSTLLVRDLAGSRLRIFDGSPTRPKTYELDLRLQSQSDKNLTVLGVSKWRIRLDGDGKAEVRLIDFQREIESLMGFTSDLDAKVYIVLLVDGRELKSVCVRRYDIELVDRGDYLELEQHTGSLSSSDAVSEAILVRISLAREPLTIEPFPQAQSEGVAAGVWPTCNIPAEMSPWFLLPGRDSPAGFRPTIWSRATPKALADLSAAIEPHLLVDAMAIENPKLREKGIRHVLTVMSADFDHPSWATLEILGRETAHLPMGSLHVWGLLAKHHAALSAAAFRIQYPTAEMEGFLCRLAEELDAQYGLISARFWRAACSFAQKSWAKQYADGELLKQIQPILLKERLSAIRSAAPCMDFICDLLDFEATGNPSDELVAVAKAVESDPSRYGRELWNGPDSLVQRLLLRAHSDDARWPSSKLFLEGLKAFYSAAPQAVKKNLELRLRAKQLFWPNTDDFKSEVANIPVLCAIWSLSGVEMDWLAPRERRFDLRKIRSFDPIWFDTSFKHGCAAAKALGFAG